MFEYQLKKSGKEDGVLLLQGSLTVDNADELKKALLKAVKKYKNLAVKFENITGLDITCLQLLCSTCKMAFHDEHTISLGIKLPPQILELADHLGFLRGMSCMPGDKRECLWFDGNIAG